MLKFVLGILVGAVFALAQEFNAHSAVPPVPVDAGVRPDGRAGIIQLDMNGYVICSGKRP